MRLVSSLMVALLMTASCSAGDAEDFAAANLAYRNADYVAAYNGYKQLSDRIENPQLYLNLGNSAFKLEKLGYAILFYERGLRLNPRSQVLRENLEYARQRTLDRASDSLAGPGRFLQLAYRYFSLHELLRVATVLWILLLTVTACMYWFELPLTSSASALFNVLDLPAKGRIAAAFLPLAMGFLLFGGWGFLRYQDESTPRAIVVEAEVKAASAPGADATVVFVIHEGTRVTVHRRSDSWVQVSLSNGYSGWIPSGAVEEI